MGKFLSLVQTTRIIKKASCIEINDNFPLFSKSPIRQSSNLLPIKYEVEIILYNYEENHKKNFLSMNNGGGNEKGSIVIE